MAHVAKNFDYLIGHIKGLSEKQIRAHFGLYQGYVKKINEIEDKLKKADVNAANYSYGEFSELMRRLPVPYNGALLHELYFENLTENSTEPSPDLIQAIESQFQSMENWQAHVRAGLLSSYGWVLLVRSKRDGILRNDLLEEHHRGVIVEQDILLALDGWEHSYMIDYGTNKSDYITVLEKSIDWNIVNQRFHNAQRMGLMAA